MPCQQLQLRPPTNEYATMNLAGQAGQTGRADGTDGDSRESPIPRCPLFSQVERSCDG